MAKRRKATPVALTDGQRERLERLWFYYGNYGPASTPGNHQFIQGLLEHGLDLRPLYSKRTPKSERPTGECERAVEAVLAAGGDGAGEARGARGVLRLVPSPAGRREATAPDPGIRDILDDMRRRQSARRGRTGHHFGGDDAA
ncbi:MAG TPA: hypothetical protein VIP46_22415 [Pyrinomonadaceae bacterium]